MPGWHVAILIFAILWGVQIAGAAWQMRHIRAAMRTISHTWHDGYVGCGAARAAWGAGGVAIVVAGPELTIRQVLLMHGRTVFARLRPVPALAGVSLRQLRSGGLGPCSRRGAAAILAAVEQVDIRAGTVSPEDGPAMPRASLARNA